MIRTALLALLLAGCSGEAIQSTVTAPAIVAAEVREAVHQVAPERPIEQLAIHPEAVALVIRWEVTSEARYRRALSRPIWPGGASGVTWAIGYDGGHQTRTRIYDDWAKHAERERLQQTAGITGTRAREALPQFADIETDWPLAIEVFEARTLPQYRAHAARAFGPAFEDAPLEVQGALTSVVYNRGPAMMGSARIEMREIRDRCLPEQDAACTAAQINAMCRLWAGTPNERGLCARRADEARLANG